MLWLGVDRDQLLIGEEMVAVVMQLKGEPPEFLQTGKKKQHISGWICIGYAPLGIPRGELPLTKAKSKDLRCLLLGKGAIPDTSITFGSQFEFWDISMKNIKQILTRLISLI
jgi:hypothetical protein